MTADAGLQAVAGVAAHAAVLCVGEQVEPVIDGTVAVVVDAVAHLGARNALVVGDVQRAVPVGAVLSRPADVAADTAVCSVCQQIERLVDGGVAVIVHAVAGLCR